MSIVFCSFVEKNVPARRSGIGNSPLSAKGFWAPVGCSVRGDLPVSFVVRGCSVSLPQGLRWLGHKLPKSLRSFLLPLRASSGLRLIQGGLFARTCGAFFLRAPAAKPRKGPEVPFREAPELPKRGHFHDLLLTGPFSSWANGSHFCG